MQFQKMVEMLKKNQREMDKKLAEFNEKTFDFNYKNNAVKLVVKGDLTITKIDIDKTLIDPEDKTMMEEMIAEAINQAIADIEKKRDEVASESMPKMPGLF